MSIKTKEPAEITEHKRFLITRMAEFGVPAQMHGTLVNYIIDARPTGGFMEAVLNNDLRSAVYKADDMNLKAIPNYVKFLHNCAPHACWGRKDATGDWREKGGIRAYLIATPKVKLPEEV